MEVVINLNKNDLRVKKTKNALYNTLMELMKAKSFEEIKVSDICNAALINRSTFYAHYSDIYEIMEQMEEHLNQELLESYPTDTPYDNDIFPFWPLIPFLHHIKKHRSFYKIVLKHRRNFPLEQGFDSLWNQTVKPKCEAAGITSETEMMYYFVYFQAGFTIALRRWVDNGCKETEEELARIIQNCIPAIWNRDN